MTNIQQALSNYVSLEGQHAKEALQSKEKAQTQKHMQRVQDLQQDIGKKITHAEKASSFIGIQLEESNAKMEEVLQPAFLNVKTIEEAIRHAVRALDILWEEAYFEQNHLSLGFSYKSTKPRPNNYATEPKPLKVLKHMEWATTIGSKDKNIRRVVPTPAGKDIAESYKFHMNLQTQIERVTLLAAIHQKITDEEKRREGSDQ